MRYILIALLLSTSAFAQSKTEEQSVPDIEVPVLPGIETPATGGSSTEVPVTKQESEQEPGQVTGQASAEVKLEKKLSASELRSEELDRLFGSLQANTGLRDPAKTQASIWELWSQSDSPTADLLLGQSGIALNDEEPNIAEEILNTVIEKYPNYAEAYNKRSTLYFRMRRYDASLKDIEKVLDLEPRHFGALSGRGMIYQQQGKTRDALKALREALAINPHLTQVEQAVKLLEKQEPDI
jgi:tetratricopeptide (TPR) repeat protein